MSVSPTQVPVETFRVRPRFQVELPLSPEQVADQINAHLSTIESPCKGTMYTQFGTIYLPEKEQHYWSPQLTLQLEQHDEKTLIRGLYGPRSSVWTMFIFLYAILTLASVTIGVIGLSYYMLDKPAKILWFIPVFIAAFLGLYFAAQAGQRMGRPQLQTLHHFIEDCLAVEKANS